MTPFRPDGDETDSLEWMLTAAAEKQLKKLLASVLLLTGASENRLATVPEYARRGVPETNDWLPGIKVHPAEERGTTKISLDTYHFVLFFFNQVWRDDQRLLVCILGEDGLDDW